ncbi:hypothetical protein CYMTET_36420 [Cymbomonas tetramitiformis]|uniref:Protein nlrc3 n=1 Tax=Cymbomonas tetramitiformis TaxID=36881 RepID=A0AAE0F7F5_9CHLO|nr:hypothetical protein CYMTET_36420 [Cymbomonas tetramitiformis]
MSQLGKREAVEDISAESAKKCKRSLSLVMLGETSELAPGEKEVLGLLFPQALGTSHQRLEMKKLHGGYSGSLVLLVQLHEDGNPQCPCVVKLDSVVQDVRDEFKLTQEARHQLGSFLPEILREPVETSEGKGGIVYELAGAYGVQPGVYNIRDEWGIVVTFKSVYLQAADEPGEGGGRRPGGTGRAGGACAGKLQLKEEREEVGSREVQGVLEELFGKDGCMRGLTHGSVERRSSNLFELHSLVEVLDDNVLNTIPAKSFLHTRTGQVWKPSLVGSFEKLKAAVEAGGAAFWGHCGVLTGDVHGDFHGGNILIDCSENAWIIDFANKKRHHKLQDVVKLMATVLFEYTRAEAGEDALGLTEALFRNEWIQQPPAPPASGIPVHMSFAYDTVRELWRFAAGMMQAGDEEGRTQPLDLHAMNLWVPLLVQAVKILKWDAEQFPDAQKQWAVRFALVLADKIVHCLQARDVGKPGAITREESHAPLPPGQCVEVWQPATATWQRGVVREDRISLSLVSGAAVEDLRQSTWRLPQPPQLSGTQRCPKMLRVASWARNVLGRDDDELRGIREAHFTATSEGGRCQASGTYIVFARAPAHSIRGTQATWALQASLRGTAVTVLEEVPIVEAWSCEMEIGPGAGLVMSSDPGRWVLVPLMDVRLLHAEERDWNLVVSAETHEGASPVPLPPQGVVFLYRNGDIIRWLVRSELAEEEEEEEEDQYQYESESESEEDQYDDDDEEEEAAEEEEGEEEPSDCSMQPNENKDLEDGTQLWAEGVVVDVDCSSRVLTVEWDDGHGSGTRRLKPLVENHHVHACQEYHPGTKVVVRHGHRWEDAVVTEKGHSVLLAPEDGTSGGSMTGAGILAPKRLTSFNHALRHMPWEDFVVARQRYAAKVVKKHGVIRDVLSGRPLRVREHLVSLRVIARDSLQDLWTADDKHAAGGQTFDIATFYTSAAPDPDLPQGVAASTFLVISGPAMGKSTLMKQVAWMCADTLLRTKQEGGMGGGGAECASAYVPLLIAAGELVHRLGLRDEGGGNSRRDLLQEYLAQEHGNHSASWRMLMQALQMRRVLVLIDGLDEAGPARPVIFEFIRHHLVAEGHRVVITCRPEALDFAQAASIVDVALNILPLNRAQQEVIVRRQMTEERAAELLTRLDDDICASPLILSLLISWHRYRAPCRPGGGEIFSAALYRAAVDAMLTHVERKRKRHGGTHVAESSDHGSCLAVLRQVAYHHHQQGKREVDSLSALAALRVDGKGGSEGCVAVWERIVELTLQDRFPLLTVLQGGAVSSGGWLVQFSHLTFQEYLCAAQLQHNLSAAHSHEAPPLWELGLERWWRPLQFLREMDLGKGSSASEFEMLGRCFFPAGRCDSGQVCDMPAFGLQNLLPALVRASVLGELDLRKVEHFRAARRSSTQQGGRAAVLTAFERLGAAAKAGQRLVKLDLSDNMMTAREIAALVDGGVFEGALRTMVLDNNQLARKQDPAGEEEVGWLSALGKGLRESTALTSLSLCQNAIGPRGAAAFAAEIGNHVSLTAVNLLYNELEREGAEAVTAAFAKARRVRTVCGLPPGIATWKWRDPLRPWDVMLIAADMTKTVTLTTLDLSGHAACGLLERFDGSSGLYDPCGMKALAQALVPGDVHGGLHSTVTTLVLKGNLIGGRDEESAEIFEALGKAVGVSTSLRALDLAGANIGAADIQALVSRGDAGTSLSTLDLAGNRIGPEGAKALAAALMPSRQGMLSGSLKTLLLNSNQFGPEGAMALAVALTPNEGGLLNASLNTLDLSDNNIGDEGAKALAVALTPNEERVFNGSLNTLSLSSNGIGLEGAKALAVALTPNEEGVFNTSLNTLDLENNQIGPEGANALVVAITPNAKRLFNRSLNTLSLSSNNIGPEGAKALAVALTPNDKGVFNGSLNTLDICDNGITGEAARQLAEVVLAHPSMKVFNKIQMQDLKDDKVTELDVSGKNIGVPGALVLGRLLVSNGSLDTLDLQDNEIGEEGAKALAVALSLNDKGVFNGSLNTLNLNNNDIRDKGAKALVAALTPNAEGVFNGSLNSITITKGVELPIGALRRNELTELNFSRKGLGPEDAIILGAVLVFNTSLNTLDLDDNKIGAEGAKALAAALTPNEQGVFNTSLNSITITKGVELPIGALRRNELTKLNFSRKNFSRKGLGPEDAIILGAVLVSNGSLNTLYLDDNEIGDEGAKALAVALTPNAEGVFNTSLNTLSVWQNAVQLEGARALVDAVKQRNAPIKLCGNLLDVEARNLSSEGLKPEDALLLANDLVFNGSLNTLILYNNRIGPQGAKALAVALTPNAEGVFNTSLNTLHLGRNKIGPEGAKALAVALTPNAEGVFNGSLNTLNLLHSNLEDDGCAAILAALEQSDTLTSVCGIPPHATEIDLSGCLRPEDMELLAGELVFNGSLNTLDICNNGITGETARRLFEAVLAHRSMKVFNKIQMQDLKDDKVTELDLSGTKIGVPGALVLGRLLVSNGSLKTLDLNSNNIGPEGAKALAVALTPNAEGVFNGSLSTLDVRVNNITGEAAELLAEAMLAHPSMKVFNKIQMQDLKDDKVTELDLSMKIIGVPGALVLGRLLVSNGSLNTLNLYDNRIGDEGAKALAVALTPNEEGVFNTSMNTLDLYDNKIGDEGANALAVALTPNAEGVFNTSLNTLSLSNNKIGDEGAKALAVALTPNAMGLFNTSLNALNVWGNAVHLEGALALAHAVKQRGAPVKLCGSLVDVEELHLRNKGLESEDALLLANDLVFNGSLNTLNLQDNQLCGMARDGNGMYDARGVKALADALAFNKSLNTVNLAGNTIGDEGATALAVALTPNEAGVFNTSLNTLDICNNGITGETARRLFEAVLAHRSMKVFNKIQMQDLKDDKVTELDLSGKKIGVPGALVLGRLLVSNGSLNKLYLDNNKIGAEGAKALAAALTPNEQGVFNTSLNSITITKGVELPIGALRRNVLTELNFSRKGLRPEDAIILGAVLVFNTSLNKLNLYENRIGPEGAEALAGALTPNAGGLFNTSMHTLDLRWNNIYDKRALRDAVRKHPNAATFKLIEN